MKKFTVLLLCVLLLISLSSLGYSNIGFGLRGGLNLANTTEDVESPEERNGLTTFGFGGFVEIPVTPMIIVQANALYNMKGANYTASGDEPGFGTYSWDVDYKSTYLSMPVLVKVVFGEGSAKPYVMAGPEAGILLSAKAKGTQEFGGTKTDIDEDIKEFLKSFELALNFGAGVQVALGNIPVFVDARYGLGLTKLHKEGDQSVKNNVIYINVGVLFGGNNSSQ